MGAGAYLVILNLTMEFSKGYIVRNTITSITAPWGDMLTSNVDLWEIIKIEGKDRVIVATKNISKGIIIAMHGKFWRRWVIH
jgi:hypothetical protein